MMVPMARRPASRTEQGFARVVNFSDAVVAIAISLLILPVVDDVSQATGASAARHPRRQRRSAAWVLAMAAVAVVMAAAVVWFEETLDVSGAWYGLSIAASASGRRSGWPGPAGGTSTCRWPRSC